MPPTFAASNARDVELGSGLEQNRYAILAVAGARIYHAKLKMKDAQWVYSRRKGTLSFVRDIESFNDASYDISETERYSFHLADNETGRTVWMFKFSENFEYIVDRPSFHFFQGRTRTYGILFNDDNEAFIFGQKVSEGMFKSPPSSPYSMASSRTMSTDYGIYFKGMALSQATLSNSSLMLQTDPIQDSPETYSPPLSPIDLKALPPQWADW